MTSKVFDTVEAAAYYDHSSVTAFYRSCWGGEDIHIGHYETGHESVAEASAAMTRLLIDYAGIERGDRVFDISCGFGGSLRALARIGCRVRGIDISKGCVEVAQKANRSAGLGDQIEVEVGDFHSINSPRDYWDAAICQESVIHSPDRSGVFSEVFRILRPSGVFAFSDILTGENADVEMTGAAFSRLGAAVGATVQDYVAMAERAGFEVVHLEERVDDIRTHYDKLAETLSAPVQGLDADAQTEIASSISRWQAAIAGGHITWACFVARKPK